MSRYYSRKYDEPGYIYEYRRNDDNHWTYQPVRRAVAYAPSYVYGDYGGYGTGYGRGYRTTSDYTYSSPYTGYRYSDWSPGYSSGGYYSYGMPRYSRYYNWY